MVYDIEFLPDAEKQLKKKRFDRATLDELDRRLQKLKEAPDVYGKPLRWPLAGVWEIRFERRWRILYTIDYQRKTVFVRGVKHKDEM